MSSHVFHKDIPEFLLNCQSHELAQHLDGPTLFFIDGVQKPPVFVSVLLHGNEITGFLAIQRLLRRAQESGRPLQRRLILLVGNVEAAVSGRRRLDHQDDFNRVWDETGEAKHPWIRNTIEVMREHPPFAVIDLHNNTGKNPFYSCISHLDNSSIYLASLFSRTVVYFHRPKTTLTYRSGMFAPSLTLECGKSGDPAGVEKLEEYLDAVFRMTHFPKEKNHNFNVDLFETIGRILVSRSQSDVQIHVREDLDSLNFRELPPGTVLGQVGEGAQFQVEGYQGQDLTSQYLRNDLGKIQTIEPFVPSMLTLDQHVMEDDCLGYLMKRRSY